MMFSLLDALIRIRDSQSTNEGPDAQFVWSLPGYPPDPCSVDTAIKQMTASSGPVHSDVVLARTLRNWHVTTRDGTELIRSHPWDDTENVARMGLRPNGPSVQSLTDYAGRLESLANEAERLGLLQHALAMWSCALFARQRANLATENARSEVARLGRVCLDLRAR